MNIHTQTHTHTHTHPCQVGILFNQHRFPMHNDKELCRLGFYFQSNPFLQIPMWPMVHRICVLRPAQLGQFTAGRRGFVQRASYFCLLEIHSNSENLMGLVDKMNKHCEVPLATHRYAPSWGSLRADLVFLARQAQDTYVIPTYKYLQVDMPPIHLLGSEVICMDLGRWAMSIDFHCDDEKNVMWALKEGCKHMKNVEVVECPRRSWGGAAWQNYTAIDVLIKVQEDETVEEVIDNVGQDI